MAGVAVAVVVGGVVDDDGAREDGNMWDHWAGMRAGSGTQPAPHSANQVAMRSLRC